MPEELPEVVDKQMAIFDFMSFARQVPVKKSKFSDPKFSDLCNHI